MSETVRPCPDIITTIARRSRTGSLAVRVIRASFRPSSIDSGRTNTLGRRATTTSRTRGRAAWRGGRPRSITVNDAYRATRVALSYRAPRPPHHYTETGHRPGVVTRAERPDSGDLRVIPSAHYSGGCPSPRHRNWLRKGL